MVPKCLLRHAFESALFQYWQLLLVNHTLLYQLLGLSCSVRVALQLLVEGVMHRELLHTWLQGLLGERGLQRLVFWPEVVYPYITLVRFRQSCHVH